MLHRSGASPTHWKSFVNGCEFLTNFLFFFVGEFGHFCHNEIANFQHIHIHQIDDFAHLLTTGTTTTRKLTFQSMSFDSIRFLPSIDFVAGPIWRRRIVAHVFYVRTMDRQSIPNHRALCHTENKRPYPLRVLCRTNKNQLRPSADRNRIEFWTNAPASNSQFRWNTENSGNMSC